ncbi:MAG TPA: 3-oxoacyl-[acyl-carrier-protein] synthase III C-terminal domain-containing protein [Stellaceae bacterium]|nr:3-oxoacyl-[acyl-carrier-protein] synthase III C-terminal domain-containing protein [Stellaceae bacterium]
MTALYLNRIAARLGRVVEAVEEARTFTAPALLRAAGFAQHHRSESESAYDLALEAVRALAFEPAAIDAVIYATCLPKNANLGSSEAFDADGDVRHLMDFPVMRLMADLGMTSALPIGLDQQACTGMLGALRLAQWMFAAEPGVKQVLCVTADRFPPLAVYEQAYNLISDGAAATLLSREPQGFRLLACHHLTNPGLGSATADQFVGSFFAWSQRLISELLAKAQLSPADIAWVVPQNTHPKAWSLLARLLHIAEDRIVAPTLASAGHVIGADNLINLDALRQSGRLRSGDRLLLTMAGFGLQWQGVILEAIDP